MHYSKGAATLLSTVFTFRVKTVVVADIVDSSNEVHPGTDTDVNGLTSTPTSSPTSAKIKLLRKRNHSVAVDVDTGILNPADTAAAQGINDVMISSSRSGVTSIASTCTTFFVDCVKGLDSSDNTKCVDKCKQNCCTYNDAVTGKVCSDGSCNGYNACKNANIPSVVNSCIGEQACYQAGGDGGSIGNVIGSCHGKHVCYYLGYKYGKVGNITDSCNGADACEYLGQKYGNVGNILNS